ncbi:UNC93 protein MFSD11, partial [Trichostrongylus colubriformis]
MDRQWWDELICIICLGIGTMCLMNGYDTQSFIVESVLHSVHMREPETIAKHAGYYGQAVLYAAYTLATLFAPWVCYRVGSKSSLLAGSLLFTIYQAGFFMLNSYYYYLSQALMGIGFALYYCGQGLYMSEHSTRTTITRNSSLVSSIGNSSMLLGGVVLIIIFYIREWTSKGAEDTLSGVELDYRNFSNGEIYVIYGVLFGCTVISNIIFALMPTNKAVDSKLETIEKSTFRTQLNQLIDTAREPKMLLLSFFFLFYGFHVSYWLGAYPTTFAFSKMLSTNIYLPAYYSAMVGLGNIIVGCYITYFDKRYANFGLIPTMISQLVLSAIVYCLTLLSTSNLSTIETNDDNSMLITP